MAGPGVVIISAGVADDLGGGAVAETELEIVSRAAKIMGQLRRALGRIISIMSDRAVAERQGRAAANHIRKRPERPRDGCARTKKEDDGSSRRRPNRIDTVCPGTPSPIHASAPRLRILVICRHSYVTTLPHPGWVEASTNLMFLPAARSFFKKTSSPGGYESTSSPPLLHPIRVLPVLSIFTDPLLTKVFPVPDGTAPMGKTETCKFSPVVAPQFRVNATASIPDPSGTRDKTSLLQEGEQDGTVVIATPRKTM